VPSFWYIIHINLLVPSDNHHSHHNAIPVSGGICIMVLPSQIYILSSCLVDRDLSVKLKQNCLSLPQTMGERSPHTLHGLNNTNTSSIWHWKISTVNYSTVTVEICQLSAIKTEHAHHKQWKRGRLTLSTVWILQILLLTLKILLEPVHYPTVKIYLQQILIIHSYSILMYKGRQTLSK